MYRQHVAIRLFKLYVTVISVLYVGYNLAVISVSHVDHNITALSVLCVDYYMAVISVSHVGYIT